MKGTVSDPILDRYLSAFALHIEVHYWWLLNSQ
jgi:hypothetical protein